MRLWKRFSILTAMLGTVVVAADPASAVFTINEIRVDHTGTDVDEYVEFRGTPSASLANHWLLVIGDNAAGTCGVLENIVDLSTYSIQADGYFALRISTGTPTLTGYDATISGSIENSDNLTFLLVTGSTATPAQDLDTNNDGVLDATPWTGIVDQIGLDEGTVPACATGDEYLYTATRIGPDGLNVPGHAWRCTDTGAWQIGQFDINGGVDTPGAANQSCTNPAPTIVAEHRNVCAPLGGQSVTVIDTVTAATSATLTYHINGGGPINVGMTQSGTQWSGVIPAQVNGTVVTYQVVATNAQGMDTGTSRGYFVGTKTIASLRNPDPVTGVEPFRFYGVRIAGTVTAAQGTFSAVNTDFWVQDGTGGIRIFKFGLPASSPALGDQVTIAGELDQFNGLLEIENSPTCGDLEISIDNPGVAPAPVLINSCDLGEDTEGLFVKMEFPFADTTGNNSANWGANKTYRIHDCLPDTVLLFIDTDTNIDGTPIVRTQMGITGISNQFDTVSPFTAGYQIIPRSLSDIAYVYTTADVPGSAGGLKARLLPNAPNPFKDATTIRYDVAGSGNARGEVAVRINLYDVAGRLTRTLLNESKLPGSYELRVDASEMGDSPSGIYFYEMLIDNVSIGTHKLLVTR
ncbi:MAG TPA: hypothetical protein VF720_16655 [Candidatus Eisenbacteria bacterium]